MRNTTYKQIVTKHIPLLRWKMLIFTFFRTSIYFSRRTHFHHGIFRMQLRFPKRISTFTRRKNRHIVKESISRVWAWEVIKTVRQCRDNFEGMFAKGVHAGRPGALGHVI